MGQLRFLREGKKSEKYKQMKTKDMNLDVFKCILFVAAAAAAVASAALLWFCLVGDCCLYISLHFSLTKLISSCRCLSFGH